MSTPLSYVKSHLNLKHIEIFVSFIIGAIALFMTFKHVIFISSSTDPIIIPGLIPSPYFSNTLIDLQDNQLRYFIYNFLKLFIICSFS